RDISNYATDAGAKRALDVFTYRVAKYVGAYAAAMEGRLDALVFTGGIGENAPIAREMVPQFLIHLPDPTRHSIRSRMP
ncbi:hypothetical protein ACQ4LF_23610, partial [Aeromonas salmonicida]